MKIIPSYYPEDGEDSERKVYSLICKMESPGEWLAFHSQNISEYHRKKKWCEIDFIVMGPRGILALEVKGGKVSCKDGIWTGKNRRGQVHYKQESPFDQSKSACYALEEALKENLDWPTIKGILFGWGVVFTDIPFDIRLAEASPQIIADQKTCLNGKRFSSYINGLYDFWEKQVQYGVMQTTGAQIHRIAEFLRPNLDLAPRMGHMAAEADMDFVRLTEDQYLFLDCTEDSDRILCRGGAGTGKTFVALECARREASKGHSILFTVESPVFAQYVRTQIQHPLVQIYDFAALESSIIEIAYDLLIIDEGQDLMNCMALDLFDTLLKGGLEHGRWRWFMDPNNQAGILGNFDEEACDILNSYQPTPLILKRNVRNTKPIATQTQLITGADIGIAENIGGGSAPQIFVVKSQESEASKLQTELQKLLNKEEVVPGDIAILSFDTLDNSCVQRINSKLLHNIVELESDGSNLNLDQHKIIFSSIHDFKGLEKKFIFIIDLSAADPMGKDLAKLYVALTRANFGLWLALPDTLQETFEKAKMHNMSNILAAQV